LYPSYWRDTACGSHFVILKNSIYWLNNRNNFERNWTVSSELEDKVLECLKEDEFTDSVTLADKCNIVPWECVQACKQLAEKGLCVIIHRGDNRYFKKSQSDQSA
jgi:hypothetical protein